MTARPRLALILALAASLPAAVAPSRAAGAERPGGTHEEHTSPAPAPAAPAAPAHGDHAAGGILGLGHAREGSGTAWQPDARPVHGHAARAGAWTFFLHYVVFFGLDHQGGERGGDRLIAPNWVMGMARRPLAGGELGARLMLSLEPLTIGPRGYPLLFQVGESYRGEPIHDRQHPHDLFMELAATWSREIARGVGLQLYVAPAGEPAIGPVAFPHRASASADPLAPLGHHWLDSTHISYGVLTAAIFTRWAKLDASWFNGREPDEMRWDLDLRVPDSVAVRLSLAPVPWLVAQASWAYLASPEGLEPDVSTHRITASVSATAPVVSGHLAALLAWGRNVEVPGRPTDSLLAEGVWAVDGHHEVFARAEWARRSSGDLAIPFPGGESGVGPEPIHDVVALAGGWLYDLSPFEAVRFGAGARLSVALIGPDLAPFYGSSAPLDAMLFLRARPDRTRGSGHAR